MTTIIINENTEEGRSLMNVIRAIDKVSDAVVRIFDNDNESEITLNSSITNVPCTREELIDAIQQSKEDIDAGRVITHDEIKKRIRTW